MNKVYSLLTLLLISLTDYQAQSVKDTILYLYFKEDSSMHKVDQYSFPPKYQDKYVDPSYHFYELRLYDGYPLAFKSISKERIRTVNLRKLKQYSVVTPEELKDFIGKNYGKSKGEYPWYYGSPYFNNLKHIYIVEKDQEKGTATLTEVKLDVQME